MALKSCDGWARIQRGRVRGAKSNKRRHNTRAAHFSPSLNLFTAGIRNSGARRRRRRRRGRDFDPGQFELSPKVLKSVCCCVLAVLPGGHSLPQERFAGEKEYSISSRGALNEV